MANLVSLFVVLGALLASVEAGAAITVGIAQPTAGGLVGDNPNISVYVTSTYTIARVRAQVDAASVDLSWSALTSQWSGNLDLTGFPSPTDHMLTIAATDVFGTVTTASQPVRLDRPPQLVIKSPLPQAVARPAIRAQATCLDDSGHCTVRYRPYDTQTGYLAIGDGSVDAQVSFESPSKPVVVVEAVDGAQQITAQTIHLYSDDSPYLTEETNQGELVLDFDADHVLAASQMSTGCSQDACLVWLPRGLDLVDRASGTRTPVADTSTIIQGATIVQGAVVYTSAATFQTNVPQGTFEWHPGSQSVKLSSKLLYATSGSYLLYQPDDTHLSRRNVATGQELQFPVISYVGRAGLTTSGDVAYAYGDVTWYHASDGRSQVLAGDSVSTVFDGINVGYLTSDGRLYLYSSGTATKLASGLTYEQFNNGVRLNGGWTAYTKRNASQSGVPQVWRRSPEGDEEQLTFFNTESEVDQVSPHGEVIVINHPYRYSVAPNRAPYRIASDAGSLVWRDNAWFLMLGRSVFRIAVPNDTIDAGQTAAEGGGDASAVDYPDRADAQADGDAADGPGIVPTRLLDAASAADNVVDRELPSTTSLDSSAPYQDGGNGDSRAIQEPEASFGEGVTDAHLRFEAADPRFDAAASSLSDSSTASAPSSSGADPGSGCAMVASSRPTAGVWLLGVTLAGLLFVRRTFVGSATNEAAVAALGSAALVVPRIAQRLIRGWTTPPQAVDHSLRRSDDARVA